MDVRDPATPLSRPQAATAANDDATVVTTTDRNAPPPAFVTARRGIQEVASAVLAAEAATAEVERLIQSFAGILEQGAKAEVPERRKNALEQEARTLAEAIRGHTSSGATNPLNPFAKPVVEAVLPLPERPTVAFRIPADLSARLSILPPKFTDLATVAETKHSITVARQTVSELKERYQATRKELERASGELDVAAQNAEAACTTVRDLDQAFALAHRMKLGVPEDPQRAMDAINPLGKRALELLAD